MLPIVLPLRIFLVHAEHKLIYFRDLEIDQAPERLSPRHLLTPPSMYYCQEITDDYLGELWQILIPRLRETRFLTNPWRSSKLIPITPGKLVFIDHISTFLNVWPKLAKPVPSTSPHIFDRTSDGAHEVTNLTSLESMPAELIAIVLEEVSTDKRDVLAFGLSSRYLWPHILSHVERSCRTEAAPWVAMEIACTERKLPDMPDSFQKGRLAWNSIKQPFNDRLWPVVYFSESARREYKTSEEYLTLEWLKILLNFPRETSCFSKQSYLDDQLVSACNMPFPNDTRLSWVFRNLDTHEYFQCACVSERRGYSLETGSARSIDLEYKRGFVRLNGEILKWLRIEDVLPTRICWGHKPSWDPHIKPQGPWAGHCFDIVAMGFSDFPNAEGWMDITADIVMYAKKQRKSRSRSNQA